jgi:hypothetical protein
MSDKIIESYADRIKKVAAAIMVANPDGITKSSLETVAKEINVTGNLKVLELRQIRSSGGGYEVSMAGRDFIKDLAKHVVFKKKTKVKKQAEIDAENLAALKDAVGAFVEPKE